MVVHVVALAKSKFVTRSQNDYFGKELCKFFSQKKLLHVNEFLNEFFCNLFFLNASHFFR
jgi:hypothetical protein